ncbi:triphosphoribosyl-dephospho-CoA protein [Streptomyces iranensis]|uniref:triphosphoribosyl-dephospho-CoA synthase n=2 Tax=Streptomyces iranensis TaxID=576784 RepID=A0A061A242_9ACTN|nr:triphosphoribosyl-dephospho-CoA synthase [Streptomyces iranensis]CDR16592.1 triphosphoribosyl-dephospho-CoA protein [Streptomyces iranensis]
MPMTRSTDEALARAAVLALIAQTELTPKPGLADTRDLQARATGADLLALRWSAKALTPGFAAMAAAARRPGEPTRALREELGAIGRCAEWTMARAGGGAATGPLHHGALWVMGLLVAAAALRPGAGPDEVTATAKRIADHPDRGAPRRPSPGSHVSATYGAPGARGEARAAFPHVRRALDALSRARAAGATETQARLDALLTVMSTLQDTGPLYRAGPPGLRRAKEGAHAVLEAGGTATPEGAAALSVLDTELRERGIAPRGSAVLLAGALFLDGLPAPAVLAPAVMAPSGR